MSLHHAPAGDCPLCEDKLLSAHLELIKWFRVIKQAFPDAHISWTFRDEANQNQCFADGKSRLKWPNSAHNQMKDGRPCARAMDLFRLRPDQVAEFRHDWYRLISEFLKAREAPIYWGGLFTTISDADHFQVNKDFE